MTTLIKTIFPAANTQDVCLIQSTTGANNLILNGNLVDKATGVMSFASQGYSRQVSFTSTNNLSSATFSIYGTQNGVSISETNITGPNIGTVYSNLIYDVISAISVNGPVTGIQVGSGYMGFFNLIPINQVLNVSNYTLSLGATIGSNQIPTAVYSTLDSINNNSSTFANIVTNNVGTLFTVKSSSASSLYIYPVSPITTVPLINQILIALNGTTSTISNSTTLIFRQTT